MDGAAFRYRYDDFEAVRKLDLRREECQERLTALLLWASCHGGAFMDVHDRAVERQQLLQEHLVVATNVSAVPNGCKMTVGSHVL